MKIEIMKKIFAILLFLMFFIASNSQNLSLSGYITDTNTGEAIIGANILDFESNKGTSTNKFGYFTIQVKKNVLHNIRFSYVGYQPKIITYKFNKDSLLTIKLNFLAENLNEIIVLSQKKIEERAETGKMSIPVSTIKTLPSITGEPDIMKVFQLMPGVQMGAENTNGLFVRGGSSDQNLFLLDDVPLYNVNHLGGFFSVFDPSMLKSVDLYKGGFPARYGGRISSVMDIRNKDGNMYKRKGEYSLGLISGKLFLEGPIKEAKSSYALSFRLCNFGIYSYLMNRMQGVDYTQGYYFYDLNVKTNFILSQRDRLFLSFYSGDDNVYYKEDDLKIERSNDIYSAQTGIKWGNTAFSLRWLHALENGIFNNTTLSYTNYRYLNSMESTIENVVEKTKLTAYFKALSGTNDFTLKNDAEIPINDNTFRFGASATNHLFIPGSVTYSYQGKNSLNANSTKILYAFDLYGYAEFEFQVLKKLTSNIGFRTGLYVANNKIYPTFEPRIVVNYLFLPSLSLKTSYSKMDQNVHLLSNSNGGLPTDIWVPSTNKIKPEISNQFSIGLAHTTKNNIEISIETYAKKIENLIDYKGGILVYNSNVGWEQKVETGGTGYVKGLEFMLQKKSGNLTGWLAYTLSSNTRKFENINNGKEYPYIYDQTHNLSIAGNYKLNKGLTFSAVWVYHTGNCVTLPTANYQLYNYDYQHNSTFTNVEVYSEKNGYRLPSYHRLDIGMNKQKKLSRGIRNWSINLYNAYNHQNAYYLYLKKEQNGTSKLYQRSFFPILLNFGYSYSW